MINNKNNLYSNMLNKLRYKLNTVDYYLFYDPTLLRRLENGRHDGFMQLLVMSGHASLFTIVPGVIVLLLSILLESSLAPGIYLFSPLIGSLLLYIIGREHSKDSFNPKKYT